MDSSNTYIPAFVKRDLSELGQFEEWGLQDESRL